MYISFVYVKLMYVCIIFLQKLKFLWNKIIIKYIILLYRSDKIHTFILLGYLDETTTTPLYR